MGDKRNISPQRRRGREERAKAIKIWDKKQTKPKRQGSLTSIPYPCLINSITGLVF